VLAGGMFSLEISQLISKDATRGLKAATFWRRGRKKWGPVGGIGSAWEKNRKKNRNSNLRVQRVRPRRREVRLATGQGKST